ncbi:hypothetical protein [Paenibacillus koleovorans]|uniref:hypothetical protein n=1 Tax=Paenibacillus koleovorans TaxID=121608 RepID=UPI000FD802F9|nr:hypothetical protein [Paenibacillus koleovorans]
MKFRSPLRPGKVAGFAVIALLIAWPSCSIWNNWSGTQQKQDAFDLLYQVASFQMELMATAFTEGAKGADTGELNELQLAAYSANFTHERLVQAEGSDNLTELKSLPELLKVIQRLQIGGERSLKADEKELLAKADALFKTMFESYGKLLNSSGKLVSSANDKLAKADGELYALLHKKLQP